jgi:hypothetical protein
MRTNQTHLIILANLIFNANVLASDLPIPTHSLALPDTAERTLLAEQSAGCAATYNVLYLAAVKNNNQAHQKTTQSYFNNYVKLSLILYGNESKARAGIDNAQNTIISELKDTKGNKKSPFNVDAEVNECDQVLFRSMELIKRSK